MRAYYHDLFTFPLPENHRFPIQKYALLRQKLLADGTLTLGELYLPEASSDEQLCLAHNEDYVSRVVSGRLSDKEIRRIGFSWTPALVERSRRSVGSTIAACRAALKEGIAANLAGGTHHAHAGYGAGYCVFNDVAVAARVVQVEGRARRVVILDCDVHQGDGTASIFANDPSVFTFSIHGEKNFPFYKESSDLDIPLPDGTGDQVYLDELKRGLEQALKRAQADLALYLAGADPYFQDRLGRLALSREGLAQRDHLVLEACIQAGLPVAIVTGGGYARCIDEVVEIHAQTIRLAIQMQKNGEFPDGSI